MDYKKLLKLWLTIILIILLIISAITIGIMIVYLAMAYLPDWLIILGALVVWSGFLAWALYDLGEGDNK